MFQPIFLSPFHLGIEQKQKTKRKNKTVSPPSLLCVCCFFYVCIISLGVYLKVQNLVVSWLLPGSWRFTEYGIEILDLTYNPPVSCLLCTLVFAVSVFIFGIVILDLTYNPPGGCLLCTLSLCSVSFERLLYF